MKNKGFTLIELLVAITIFLIASAGFMTFINNLIYHRSFANKMTQAIHLAKSKLEDLKTENFYNLSDGNETIGRYRIEWTIQEVEQNIKDIDLTIGCNGNNCLNNINNCDHIIKFSTSVINRD